MFQLWKKRKLLQMIKTYAKQQLGVKLNETKMLGLPWNNDEDTLAVEIPSEVKMLIK